MPYPINQSWREQIELNWCTRWLMGYGIKISIPRPPRWRRRSPRELVFLHWGAHRKDFFRLWQLKRFADEHVVIRDFFTVINRKWIWPRPQFKFLTRLHGILPSRYPVAPKDPKFKSNKPKLSTIMQDVSNLKFKVKNFPAESRQIFLVSESVVSKPLSHLFVPPW